MTVEECQPSWKDQLVIMGFPSADIERADQAGVRDVTSALDFITSALTTESADKTDANFTSFAPSAHQNPPFNTGSHHTTSLSNARNSLDHTDIARVPTPDSYSTQGQVIQMHPDPLAEPLIPHPTSQQSPSNSNNNPQKSSPEDDLSRALELSRKDQDEREMAEALKVSKQQEATTAFNADRDPEFMRAIEESIKENQRFTNDRTVSWQSHAFHNNTDGRRVYLDDPVGLRNIGNTCYLNSLLQVYYHLSDFRRAIMSFRPSIPVEPCAPHSCDNDDDITNPSLQNAEGITDDAALERKSETTSDGPRPPTAPASSDTKPDVVMTTPDPGAPSPTRTTANENATTVHGETSVSDKSDNRSERQQRKDKDHASKKHAVEFVIELQRLFAAMALGDQLCIDPTAVARAMRDGDGNPIKIGDQQDASEFNHLFLDIVERGLRSEQADNADGGTNESHGVSNSVERTVEQQTSEPGNAEREETEVAVSKSINLVKDMFTVKFRQEVSHCDTTTADEKNATDSPVGMVSEGETNCIIVDATTSKERDLYSGLEDYAVARIECNASRSAGDTELASKANASTEVVMKESDGQHVSMPTMTSPGMGDKDTAMGSNAMSDIDDAAMGHSRSTSMLKSVWLTKLPPVVVIYLQRVRYIREKLVAEKVHDKYDFGTEIALDRYLEANREASLLARSRVEGIRKERRRLLAMVRKYRNFGDGNPTSKEEEGGGMEADVPMKDAGELFSAGERIRKRLKEAVSVAPDNLFGVDAVSKEQVDYAIGTIDRILEHDRECCEGYERELNALESEADVYRGLGKVQYRLHAVLVHDGAPSGGHYWTFIRDWGMTGKVESNTTDIENTDGKTSLRWNWLKFSDSTVSRVKEEDMLLWSAGGHGRASAYCLIYTAVSCAQPQPGDGVGGVSISEESRALLPAVRLDELFSSRTECIKETVEDVATVVNIDEDVKTPIGPEPLLNNQTWHS